MTEGMSRGIGPLLVSIGLFLAPATARPAVDDADDNFLRAAGVVPDSETLLGFLRRRATPTPNRAELQALVARLGAAQPLERERALGLLVAIGPPAIPLLRSAMRDPDDAEVALGAQRCLNIVEGPRSAALTAALIRVLVRLRPEGTLEALLAALPFMEDDVVVEEIANAFGLLAFQGQHPSPALVSALKDPSGLRRIMAAEALIPGAPSLVRPLLRDSVPTVRLRAAMALLARKDETAVDTLIELISEKEGDTGKRAEEALLALAAESAPQSIPMEGGTEAQSRARTAWETWWKTQEGSALLEEFRLRTLTPENRRRVEALIRQLGDDRYPIREEAQAALSRMSSAIAPLLREALRTEDQETRKRAQKCLVSIDKDRGGSLIPLARIVALRKPKDSATTLLAYLPFADDDTVRGEVQAALSALATREGPIDPVFEKGLTDVSPLQRAATGEALAGNLQVRPQVLALLKDPDATVRLRVALALATTGVREALPVLVDLLADVPLERALEAERFLRTLAEESAPGLYLGPDPALRAKVKSAWSTWWMTQGAHVNLARLGRGPRQLGLTVIACNEIGRIFEVGLDGRIRWSLEGLQYPRDVQVVGSDRVLVAEQGLNRVSEWSLRRELVWQKQLSSPPVSVQRLPGGNTFIAMTNRIVEVDRAGKEVFIYNRPTWDIVAGHRGPDRQTVFVTGNSQMVVLDSEGKEARSLSLPRPSPTSVELLAGGRILVPSPGMNKVVEYDSEGKIVWEAAAPSPQSATRLPNGHTLVASVATQRILELNRSGRVVWEHRTDGMERPFRARRR